MLPVLLFATPAFAQITPDGSAQEFQRQQERERALRGQQEVQPDVRLPDAVDLQKTVSNIPDEESPCFTVSSITLDGESADQFRFALGYAGTSGDPALGRCLGTNGINVVTRRIQQAIVARGYVTTRIVVPPQDMASGELKLFVVPGRIHAIRFAEHSDPRATKWNAIPAAPGYVTRPARSMPIGAPAGLTAKSAQH